MVMTMAMAVPGMPLTQHYRTILLGPVENPKPHDSTQSLSGDTVPTLRLMNSNSFVGHAMSVSTSHLSSFLENASVFAVASTYHLKDKFM
ncbi:nadh dehydrogenase [ubiquinone] 1 beta subcomplex subunit 2 [Nicotiana attenuata]|uniref:Nadh dehydrogenase [ubiquinone] 1 beta subcomplex subunit 2 n=1 Tax=Nicotiana attenuata TaxID=49451 RepID=A0A1J6IC26_NICAT|nr:nadh dehydrogenase [ubiquinone] 1 beta subcomplex subunit 2 [Nicotiana attenuata]